MSSPAVGSRVMALQRLRTAMIEKKLTQAELADAADCHEKTIQNLLNGRSVRDQTLFDVCMVLGLDFDVLKREWVDNGPAGIAPERAAQILARPPVDERAPAPAVAPLHMGAYTRQAVDHYIGSYLTIRPAFRDGGIVHAYRTDIAWDDVENCLSFVERDRPDAAYSHRGHLYVPASSMFVHLVSLTKGAMRMILVAQLDPLGRMRGIITTLTRTRGAMFMPVAAPIVYLRSNEIESADLGELAPGHGRHQEFRELLTETLEQSYARLQMP